jgi:hypothetical protein
MKQIDTLIQDIYLFGISMARLVNVNDKATPERPSDYSDIIIARGPRVSPVATPAHLLARAAARCAETGNCYDAVSLDRFFGRPGAPDL